MKSTIDIVPEGDREHPGRLAASLRIAQRGAPVWVTGLAVALIAAIVVGLLLVFGPQQFMAGRSRTSPGPSPFVCMGYTLLNGPHGPPISFVDAVQVGTHTGYDRITIKFSNGQPTKIEVQPQGTLFVQPASGTMVQLRGIAGLLLTIQGANEHTHYSGPYEFNTGDPFLLEARQMQDFEGTVQWGLALNTAPCYRAYILTNPTRLVIDIQ